MIPSDHHAVLRSDNEELELEHDRLLTRHNTMVQDTEQKESSWKERLNQLKTETVVTSDQQNETIRHLAQQNETISLTFKVKTISTVYLFMIQRKVSEIYQGL